MARIVLFFIVNLFMYENFAHAEKFSNSNYDVCFTPGGECTNLIVNNIKKSKSTIRIQAYSFTSAPIAQALVDAKKRGVDVKVILDKSQFSASYSSSKFLLNNNIPVWNDERVTIAHNKVIIIDNKTVITGSFNFTKSAQERNAENVIVITDSGLAKKYNENWNKRMALSETITN